MLCQSSKQISVTMFIALLFAPVPVYAVTNYKTSNFAGAHQIWFEAEHFDERNPATDEFYPVVDVAGAHHGTASAGATYVLGKTGQAISLNGNDYVDCGNPSQLDFGTGNWTVAAWVNAASSTETMIVFSNGGDDSGAIRYVLSVGQSADHTVTLTVDDNATKAESIGSIVVDDGQWHHIVGIRDGNRLRIYVDGFQGGADVTLPAGYDLSGTSQANAYIGAGWNFATSGVQKFLSGAIDEVRIYNYALPQAEITGLAGMTKPFDEPL